MFFTSARRDLRLVVGARSVSWLGDEVAMVALTLKLQSDGRGPTAIAALLIANALPIVVLSGVVGRVVDRVDNRALLIWSSAAQAVICAALAFTASPVAVLVLVGLLGAGQAVNSATWQALVPALVGQDGLPRAIGLTQAGMTLAGILAPPLGGLLTGFYGARVPLLIDAGSFLAVLGAALMLHTNRVVAAPVSGAKPSGGLSIVWSDSLLRPLFGLLALFVLLGSMVNVAEVFLVRETLHASTIWYGISGAAFSAGALTAAVLSSRLSGTVTLARGFVGSAALLALGLVGLGCAPSVLWLLPIGFVTGAGNGVLNVTLSSLVMGRARDEERGRVGALLGGVASGTQLTAFAIAGGLAEHLGPRTLFMLAGGFGLLAPILLGHRVVRAAAEDDQADSLAMTSPSSAA